MKLPQKLRATPTMTTLSKWNVGLAVLFAVELVVILLLGTTKTYPVNMSYLTVDSLQSTTTGHAVLAPATHHLFDINLAYLVAVFLGLAALAHLSMATWYRRRYEQDLEQGVNHLRWFEYALSASVMLVGIAVVAGMYDAVSLGLVFVLSVVANLLALAMETHNPFKKRQPVNWTSYVVGCIAAAVPWLGIAAYLAAANIFGNGHLPAFVYWVYVSLLVLFVSFAVNLWLQYRKLGPWKNYLYGERWYMILSLLAKSVLAWELFAGVLRP